MNPILLERDDGVVRLTLNRPERLNAMSVDLMLALRAALDEIAADKANRCLLLTGAGRGFCAGADLSGGGIEPGESDLGDVIHNWFNPVVRQLHALPMPIVAAVNGIAAGGGASLALAADIALAARSAGFSQVFCRIALVPDVGSTYFLPRTVGPARALGMAMLGEVVSAEDAAAQGMIWRCVEDADLLSEATRIARRLAQGPTASLVATRRLLRRGADAVLDEQLEAEALAQSAAGRRADFAEGVSAFLAKRPAAFTGR